MKRKQDRIQILKREITRLKKRVDILDRQSLQYSWIRVALFFGGLALSLVVGIFTAWFWGSLLALLILVVFAVMAFFHGRTDRSLARFRLWGAIKRTHVARMELDWQNIPTSHVGEVPTTHPYAADIDIVGEFSLHRLLNTAISREGSLRLLDWLLNREPDLEVTHKRQALVNELTPMTRFRDKLTMKSLLAADRERKQLDGKRLLLWLEKNRSSARLGLLLGISIFFNLLTPILLILTFFVPDMPQLWYLSIVLGLLFFFGSATQRGDIFDDASYLSYGFSTLSSIFTYLETYPYAQKTRLRALCAPFFEDAANRPSVILTRVARISGAATLRTNGLVWLLVNALIPWDAYIAYRLRNNKEKIEQRLPIWLERWYELEAHCSLAAFAYLNPEYTMPEVVAGDPESGAVVFDGKALGHPLISEEKKVCNDFKLLQRGEVVIITGSNMSGKSTFLRTWGLNLCLAYAGTVVDAQSLSVQLFRLFTCIRVSDSVADGYSYFYAEVRRLKALLEELNRPDETPLVFLVDEIFKGTNNRERLIGSRSFIKSLVGRNCIGAISTHDLELVKLADQVPDVLNYHFREDVIEGQMVFDYTLRPGPSPTTNALKIMRMEGLPVEDPQ